MSSNKEEKTQAEKFKAQALSNAKGLSRAQAERAAAAAARNVNAYGQKEEGPSRWQERKEAKRQMYLMSTEKAVRLGERKDLKSSNSAMGSVASQCQKCFQTGHWTYECKNERVYISRPSRSQQLKNPKLRQKLMVPDNLDNPDIKKEENGEEQKSGKKSKRKHRSGRSDSEASVFDSESGSSSASGSESEESRSSYSSSSDSEEERRRLQRKKRKQRKGKSRRRRYTSSSSEDSDDSELSSDSASDSEDHRRSNRKKSKRHSRRS